MKLLKSLIMTEVKPLVQTLDENENKEDDQVNEDNVVTGLAYLCSMCVCTLTKSAFWSPFGPHWSLKVVRI